MNTTIFRILTREAPTHRSLIPRWWVWSYSLFVLTLVPIYLVSYGPTNFCYFCDLALLLTAITMWTGRALPASIAAVAILVPQALWIVDFIVHCCGWPLIGMTDYMFNAEASRGLRALSLFHLWLPLLLLLILHRIGYDRRAFICWLPAGLLILLINRLLMPAPPAPVGHPELPVNINLVFGFTDSAVQTWMPGWMWFSLLCIALVGIAWWPTHVLLRRFMPPAERR